MSIKNLNLRADNQTNKLIPPPFLPLPVLCMENLIEIQYGKGENESFWCKMISENPSVSSKTNWTITISHIVVSASQSLYIDGIPTKFMVGSLLIQQSFMS